MVTDAEIQLKAMSKTEIIRMLTTLIPSRKLNELFDFYDASCNPPPYRYPVRYRVGMNLLPKCSCPAYKFPHSLNTGDCRNTISLSFIESPMPRKSAIGGGETQQGRHPVA